MPDKNGFRWDCQIHVDPEVDRHRNRMITILLGVLLGAMFSCIVFTYVIGMWP